jgi:hypothetical protein
MILFHCAGNEKQPQMIRLRFALLNMTGCLGWAWLHTTLALEKSARMGHPRYPNVEKELGVSAVLLPM